MIPQFKELVGRYKPTLIFTDGEWSNTAEQRHAAEFLVGYEAIANDRWGHGADYGYRTRNIAPASHKQTVPGQK